MGSVVCCCPWGLQESGTTERLQQQQNKLHWTLKQVSMHLKILNTKYFLTSKLKQKSITISRKYPHISKSISTMSYMLSHLSGVQLCNPMDYSLSGSYVPWDSQARITGVGVHALLQGIFLAQGLDSCLLGVNKHHSSI